MDVIYIIILTCILLFLIIPNNQISGNTADSDTEAVKNAQTYYLNDEGYGDVPSWIIIIPDNIWVNSKGDYGTYSYHNGEYSFFFKEEKLYTARLTDSTLVIDTDADSLIYRHKKP